MRRFQPKVFMFVPTMACQAGCRYCYAKKSGDRMSPETAVKAVDFIERFAADGAFKIIFHGGEPLLAGEEFYSFILPVIRERFGRRAGLGMQSNLWAMDEKMAHLLRAYEVEVGTSIDGYREMCDDQRGVGYYDRTQAGAGILRAMGAHVGRICTFSAAHAEDAEKVFREAESGYTIHAAIPAYGEEKSPLVLSPEQFTRVLTDTYHAYRSDLSHAKVGLLDSMASALLKKKAGLCTFSDCLG
ncbi:MAG: radical SAM protein, partial [Anaerolineaceae bacterium]|nr:radical SAM protein [Anaerolineaceae bacterium]